MKHTILKSKENIKIELKEYNYGTPDVIATVDGIDYAAFTGIKLDDLNLDLVREWIEETYYDESYKSPAYSMPYLNGDSFSNNEGF